ncbi:MAG: hypothetical protein RR382_01775 [Tannerellaceae bacterium]
MDVPIYIARFLYHIRYQVILGSLLVTALVAYFTQFLPQSYTVNTSIYTGIASSSGLETENNNYNFFELNNTFDNLINLTKAKGTLEKVSLKLFALNMIKGDSNVDNTDITAKKYKELLKIVPPEVSKLINKQSLEKTIENLNNYKTENPHNFMFELFNWNHPHYSYNALKSVSVKRVGNSDLIEISFRSDDPGITVNTVKFINEELMQSYDGLRYKSANDVVKYYEEQLIMLRSKLDKLENSLTDYNIENKVINYGEQTKAIAISYSNYEDRYELARQAYESSSALIAKLEKQMEMRSKLFSTNTQFINALDSVSTINGKITEIEVFSTEEAQTNNKKLQKYKEELTNTEKNISQLSNDINDYKYSKEGVAVEGMVDQWLFATITNTKAKAELKVLDMRRKDFADQYKVFSPIGTQINRKEREIRVIEESYLEVLHGLNLAKLKQKNIQLTSATLNIITPPTYPLISDGRKRGLLTAIAFMGSILFIIGFNLVVELLDRTLRDAERARRLTNTPILGAFTGRMQLKYRGYIKACNRISAAYACNTLNRYLEADTPMYINLLSIESKEGKSFVAKYFLEEWDMQGLHVQYLLAGKDFPMDATYLLAKGFDTFVRDTNQTNIVLIEYPAILSNTITTPLLAHASVNIVVANACRVWKDSDTIIMNNLKERSGVVPLYLYLNNATREAVEEFTGQLPPDSSTHTLASKIRYMGLTARSTAVK